MVAGTGAQSTRETKKLNQDAHEAGATFALVLTPTVWHKMMNTENILRFHREVCRHATLPVRYQCLNYGFYAGRRRLPNPNYGLQLPWRNSRTGSGL